MTSLFRLSVLLAALLGQHLVARDVFVLAIGLNSVDPTKYSGWEGKLVPCEEDAKFIYSLIPNAKRELLLTKKATRDAVKKKLEAIADKAVAGDLVVIGYSGHGTQVPDTNGDEAENHPDDKMDEAWCLYDGVLVDDELFERWARFAVGVEIVVVSDSCHAGTMTKEEKDHVLRNWSVFAADVRAARFEKAARTKLAKANRPTARTAGVMTGVKAAVADMEKSVPLSLPVDITEEMGNPSLLEASEVKQMPLIESYLFQEQYAAQLAEEQKGLKGEALQLKASVYLFASCQDQQTSLAPATLPLSLYTFALRKAWNGGNFSGSYADLFEASRGFIPAQLRADHMPNAYGIGADPTTLSAKPAFR